MGVVIEQWDEVEHGQKVYRIRIDAESLATVNLTPLDRLQLESPHSSDTPLADKLLDLQTIVLRIEQQAAGAGAASAHPKVESDTGDK